MEILKAGSEVFFVPPAKWDGDTYNSNAAKGIETHTQYNFVVRGWFSGINWGSHITSYSKYDCHMDFLCDSVLIHVYFKKSDLIKINKG